MLVRDCSNHSSCIDVYAADINCNVLVLVAELTSIHRPKSEHHLIEIDHECPLVYLVSQLNIDLL